MPRDGWWSNRAKLQWTEDFFETSVSSVADQMEALAEATSVDDLFARFEACGASYRLDPDITPTMFHGATISASELNALRQIKDIVRMGRVKSIQREAIILERGELASRDDCLYVDCSATGIPLRPNVPVFNDRRITLQFVRAFRPCLSAAAIAFIEAHFADDAEKNTLCAPVPPVTAGLGWVRIVSISMANHARWSNHPELMRWLASSRLDGGVHGDHWVKGCWKSTEGGKPHPDVQICIMNARCIQLIAQERPNWPPAGDNLFIDMDLSPDNTPPGTRLGIGTAVIEITAIPHNGCASFAARYGRDATVFVNTAEGRQLRLRGIYGRVTKDGLVSVGDKVAKLLAKGSRHSGQRPACRCRIRISDRLTHCARAIAAPQQGQDRRRQLWVLAV